MVCEVSLSTRSLLLCLFPITAIRRLNKLGDLNNGNVFFHSSEGQKSEINRGVIEAKLPPRALGGNPSSASSFWWWPEIHGDPWFMAE